MPRRAPEISLALPARERGETLATWLYRGLRAAILAGRLHRGARVPATRDLAARHGVSRGVVVAAYERLHDEGYLVSRAGSGTIVNDQVFEDHQLTPTRPVIAAPARRRPRARAFSPIEPAVSEFPIALWARLSARTA